MFSHSFIHPTYGRQLTVYSTYSPVSSGRVVGTYDASAPGFGLVGPIDIVSPRIIVEFDEDNYTTLTGVNRIGIILAPIGGTIAYSYLGRFELPTNASEYTDINTSLISSIRRYATGSGNFYTDVLVRRRYLVYVNLFRFGGEHDYVDDEIPSLSRLDEDAVGYVRDNLLPSSPSWHTTVCGAIDTSLVPIVSSVPIQVGLESFPKVGGGKTAYYNSAEQPFSNENHEHKLVVALSIENEGKRVVQGDHPVVSASRGSVVYNAEIEDQVLLKKLGSSLSIGLMLSEGHRAYSLNNFDGLVSIISPEGTTYYLSEEVEEYSIIEALRINDFTLRWFQNDRVIWQGRGISETSSAEVLGGGTTPYIVRIRATDGLQQLYERRLPIIGRRYLSLEELFIV